MSEKYVISDLIDIKRLQPMLDRLYAVRNIPIAVVELDGSIVAHCVGYESRQKRAHSNYSCMRKTLAHDVFAPPYQEYKCTHGLLTLVFPIIVSNEPLGYLFLNHLAIENPDNDGPISSNTNASRVKIPVSPSQYEEIKAYYSEFAELLANTARIRLEHKQALQTLKERDRLFQLVTDNMADSVWIMDLNLNFTYATPSVFRKRGYSLEEIQKMPLEKHMTPESYAKATEIIVQSLQKGPENDSYAFTVDMEYYRRDGSTFWSETQLSFIRDAEGEITGILGVGRDITERKRAEQSILELNAALENRVNERTSRLREVNRDLESFSYSVAHDLKAPLRAMDGYSQILLDEYKDVLDEEGLHYLGRIRNASQNMSQVIDGLLRLSHVSRQQLNLSRIDLVKIARDTIDELSSQVPNRQVEFIAPPQLLVAADSSLMRIALNNLITNAWKFTEKRGLTCIEIGVQDSSDPSIYFVKDNGVGFEMTHSDKLFQPFQRLHQREEFEGNGIGLTIVHRIDRHGGQIWAEGVLNDGACFYFTLPPQSSKEASTRRSPSKTAIIPSVPPSQ